MNLEFVTVLNNQLVILKALEFLIDDVTQSNIDEILTQIRIRKDVTVDLVDMIKL
jgi:hypothetical protein